MRLNCTVEVVNRILPTLNLNSKRPQRSTLSLMVDPKSKNNAFILHQTLNGLGTRYKVEKENIENLFTRFINEGKATIRFKTPPHDLCVQCDVIQLKCFFKQLGVVLHKGAQSDEVKLSTVSTVTRVPPTQKTRLVIMDKKDYPQLQGFSRTLNYLKIVRCSLKTVDSRILKLQNLQILDLSSNRIEYLPEGLGQLSIRELYLCVNNLGSRNDWKWMYNSQIQNSLKLLDIQRNKLKNLPEVIGRLRALVELKIDHNDLVSLPSGIGKLTSLKYLTASYNKIKYLPATIRRLRLSSIDLCDNDFGGDTIDPIKKEVFMIVPPLVELCARSVVLNRLVFSEKTLPRTLCQLIELESSECICMQVTFSSYPQGFFAFPVYSISSSTTWTVNNSEPIIRHLCLRYLSAFFSGLAKPLKKADKCRKYYGHCKPKLTVLF